MMGATSVQSTYVSAAGSRFTRWRASPRWQMFVSSPLAVASAAWLALILVLAFVVAPLVVEQANHQTIGLRFFPRFSWTRASRSSLEPTAWGGPSCSN